MSNAVDTTAQVSMREFRSNLAEWVAKVAFGQQKFLIMKNNKPAAALVPVAVLELLEKFEDGFDLKEAREALEEGGSISAEELYEQLGI